MPEGRLKRTRENYPEGVPAFGQRDPWGWESNYLKPSREALRAQLDAFQLSLLASQKHLPEAAAKVIRDNLWNLYESTPSDRWKG